MARVLRLAIWFCFAAAGLLMFTAESGAGNSARVAVIPVQGTVDPGMVNFVRRSFEAARQEDAAAVILKMNTPGGYIASAEAIKVAMDDFPGPIHALVKPKAISAGAYLALSADTLYMVPGATMGAAAPRAMGGMAVDEKTLSWWEAEMRSAAERRGRDPQVAAAMVRPEIAIPDLVEQGELLTLTAAEALETGYSEGTVSDLGALLDQLNLSDAVIQEFQPTFTDNMVRWVTNPTVATILLMIGLGGLILEITTAGFGLAGLLSMIAFALFFGGHIAAGLAEYWVLFLFIFGVALMLVEAFFPGFGVFGIVGLLATVASIVLATASVQIGLIMLAVALILAGVLSALTFRFFTRRGVLRHIILSDEERSELGYVAPVDRKHLLGLEGKALTPLRPAGVADIAGQRVDVVSEGGYIAAGGALKVVQVEGVRVVVRSLDSLER